MSLKTHIARTVARTLTSPTRERLRRRLHRLRRRGGVAEVHYFHQADDPYSQLAAAALARLAQRYAIRLVPHLVGPPADAAAPDRERLARWSLRDARTLAAAVGDATAFPEAAPNAQPVALAEAALLAALRAGRFADAAPRIGAALWAGAPIEGPDDATAAAVASQDLAAAKAEGEALRRRFGHYLGATFCCGGESYWGLDRLHHLERRLRDEGLCRAPALPLIAPPRELRFASWQRDAMAPAPVLHWYCSFRSPYTYLSAARVQQLAEHYRAELRIRFVLPMVMRGLPVPREKRLYIVEDCAREARRLGRPFGDIVDPVGKPVERGYAALHAAIAAGRGMDFAQAFLRGVWAEGIAAGSDAGLVRIAARAGFDASFVHQALARQAWRAEAEANRAELLAMGLWGVPSFRVDDRPAHWGQDRLWAVEEDLIAARGASGGAESSR